jgi:release factor glutamine methyltransferase
LKLHHVQDANLSAKILLSFVTKFSKVDLIRESEHVISEETSKHFQTLVQKRSKGFPIAYLIGEKEFYSLKFLVNKNVLIPRPETEMLIEWFREKIGDQKLKVCDVGTGSGAIAITLKKNFPSLDMTGVDISPAALTVAKKNATLHDVRVTWVKSDLLKKARSSFDVVIANLPYIPAPDIALLPRSVLFEPVLALESGRNGLKHYKQLLSSIKKHLNPKGSIFFEFGWGQKENLISLLPKKLFSSIETRKDLAGIDRILYAQRN